jgi:hypothetical protein
MGLRHATLGERMDEVPLVDMCNVAGEATRQAPRFPDCLATFAREYGRSRALGLVLQSSTAFLKVAGLGVRYSTANKEKRYRWGDKVDEWVQRAVHGEIAATDAGGADWTAVFGPALSGEGDE